VEKPHKKLDVWQVAMGVAKAVYDLTKQFPEEEKYGLVSQMRRAAVSIPCNFAEGRHAKARKNSRTSSVWRKVLSVNWILNLKYRSCLATFAGERSKSCGIDS
jgi:hypothetical protein